MRICRRRVTLPVDRRKRLLNPCGRTGTDTADGVSPRSSTSAGSGTDRFESSFQTFGCLVSRHIRLLVKSFNRAWKNRDRHRGRIQSLFFHATSWSRREERGQTPRTESVPFPPWSRWMLCESDVDVGISRVISMFGNSVCCSKELSEGLATGWPIGQPLASRLASPISFNHWGLEICGQDWPGWPRCHCFGVFGEAVLFVFLVSSRDAVSTVRFLLSGDLRCR